MWGMNYVSSYRYVPALLRSSVRKMVVAYMPDMDRLCIGQELIVFGAKS